MTPSAIPIALRTPRLLLRGWTPTDADALQTLLVANAADLAPWLPAHVATAVPIADLSARLTGYAADFAAQRAFRFALLTPDGSRLLGEADLFPRRATGRVALAQATEVELGYWLDTRATRQGLVTEALTALLELGGKLPGVTRAEIRCDSENVRSAAVARRLGFLLDEESATGQVWARQLDAARS